MRTTTSLPPMRVLTQAMKYFLLLVGVVAMAFPFYWMIITSFKPDAEALQFPPTLWPQQWTLENYRKVFELVPMGRYLLNSAFVATAVTAGVLITSAMAAHAFVRMRFPGRNVVFAVMIATMMIPFEVLLIPDYLIIRGLPTGFEIASHVYGIHWDLGGLHLALDIPFWKLVPVGTWYNTYLALIVPWMASVFGIFLLRQTFMTLPDDLWEAVLLDGGGHLRYLFSVALPLSVPALITLSIITFLGSWNSLLWPLVVTDTPELRPVQVGLASFQTEAGLYYNLSMAAATISILPILILYLLAQRYFVEGIARTGMKS